MTTSPGRTSSASACASRIFSASVCGSCDLLEVERARHPLRRRPRTSCRCRRGWRREPPDYGRRPPLAGRPGGSRAGSRRPRSPARNPTSRLPVTIRLSQPFAARKLESAVPKNAEAKSLFRTGSPASRRDPRIDLHPAGAGLQRHQGRNLVDERCRRVLAALVVGHGREDDRYGRSRAPRPAAAAMASTTESRSHTSGDAGSVKPRLTSITIRAGLCPKPTLPWNPSCLMPRSLLYTGAGIPSPALTRASASSPGSSGDHRSGTAGTGGSSPVSSLQLASSCSRGGP